MATRSIDAAFIGAGAIHFGGAEGPWDHSARLEKIPGLRFIAIVDPDVAKATAVLERKQRGPSYPMYADCKVYPDIDELLKSTKPALVFLGIPPVFHGSKEPGKDLELTIISAGIPLFVEKPMSVIGSDRFNEYASEVEKIRKEQNVVISVGYMFRYHAAVLKMKELIANHGGKVMVLNARYYTAYSEMDHPFWWDINKSGGPIVEQATHFCDLARFLVGDVDLDTVQTTCLRETDAGGAGKLNSIKEICEKGVASENRIPRVTISTWRFKDGGLGTMTHAVALHGKQYETSIEVLMDGLRLTLYEPYTSKCKLLVRDGSTGTDNELVHTFVDEDPYAEELNTFIEAVTQKKQEIISSSYSDAAKTYEFSWAIRLGEK